MSEFPFRDEDFVNKKQTSTFSNLFSTFQQDNKNINKVSKIFTDFKGKISDKTSNVVQKVQNKGEEIQQVTQNWQQFAFFFGLGLFCFFLSTFYLPFIIILPAKFASAFTLGSLNILISIATLRGFQNFLKSIFSKDKSLITISYIITIIGTLYFSIIKKSYLYVIAFSLCQLISLSFLLASNFPGGVKGMKMITSKLFSCIKSIIMKICGFQEYKLLPF